MNNEQAERSRARYLLSDHTAGHHTTPRADCAGCRNAVSVEIEASEDVAGVLAALGKLTPAPSVPAMPTLTDTSIVDAVNGLCWAASRFNLHQFCEILDWHEDEYAEAKFRDLQQAARLLGRFDNATLATLARAGRAPRQVAATHHIRPDGTCAEHGDAC